MKPYSLIAPDNPSHFDLERISIIQKHIRIFSILPWISFVAICNSTAFYQSKEDSDIDLFIQCDPKRIMLVRIFLNLALRFSGILRSSGDEKKKVCLSFFHARENLLPIALKTDNQVDDPYFCAWIQNLRVIYERKDEFSQFISRHTWA
jgi:predicted nucleotidyltransferase